MEGSEFRQLFGGNIYTDNSARSLTLEEIQKENQEDCQKAKEGVNAIRRQLIVKSLEARGIDPSTVDIDRIIKETTPEIKKN